MNLNLNSNSTETQDLAPEGAGNVNVAAKSQSHPHTLPVDHLLPVIVEIDALGVHERDRLRESASPVTVPAELVKSQSPSRSPGYIRNYAAAEMRRTHLIERALIGVLAVGGLISIWGCATGMTDLLAGWTKFTDLAAALLR